MLKLRRALKDSYVFSASLQLSLSQGNTHTKNGVFQKMHKDNKFLFARRRNEHWKERLRREREENEERATAVLYVCSAAEELRCILPLLRLYNGALWEGLLFRSALDGNTSPLFLIRAKQLGLPFTVVNRRFIFCFPVSQMLKQHIWDSGSGLKTKAVRTHTLLTNVSLFRPRHKGFCFMK